MKDANAWGLRDVLGNVWEWCWDWHMEIEVSGSFLWSTLSNPLSRVLRGGCWDSPGYLLRSANRFFLLPDARGNGIGFRIVRN